MLVWHLLLVLLLLVRRRSHTAEVWGTVPSTPWVLPGSEVVLEVLRFPLGMLKVAVWSQVGDPLELFWRCRLVQLLLLEVESSSPALWALLAGVLPVALLKIAWGLAQHWQAALVYWFTPW